jgi:hypothetical protein
MSLSPAADRSRFAQQADVDLHVADEAGKARRPFDRVVDRVHLHDRESGNQLLLDCRASLDGRMRQRQLDRRKLLPGSVTPAARRLFRRRPGGDVIFPDRRRAAGATGINRA